jgi:hypothetical protein
MHDVVCAPHALLFCQGVESQEYISSAKSAINAALAAGKSFGPDIPWRPVDYFEHLSMSSADVLGCSVIDNTAVNRQCLQKLMSSWNARYIARCSGRAVSPHFPASRFTKLVLSYAKKLLPLQRDLRGEAPLEICALHGDGESVADMLQYIKVGALRCCFGRCACR